VVLFGPGNNPRNFVAAADVARLVVLALEDIRLQGTTIEIGGPENFTSRQVVATFERVAGTKAKGVHIPLPALRVLSRLVQAVHPGVSRILKATIVGETTDQNFDPAPFLARFPVKLIRLEDWARSRYSSPQSHGRHAAASDLPADGIPIGKPREVAGASLSHRGVKTESMAA
jgi:hypothetical protein